MLSSFSGIDLDEDNYLMYRFGMCFPKIMWLVEKMISYVI